MWLYSYAYDFPLVTLILNIYGFVNLAPFLFLAKVPFLAFLYRKGFGHIDMLITFPWCDTDGIHPMLFAESCLCMPKF